MPSQFNSEKPRIWLVRRIPAHIKIKLALPPPPFPKIPRPPPPKTRNFIGMGFPAERTKKCQAPIDWCSRFRPQIEGGKITDVRLFRVRVSLQEYLSRAPRKLLLVDFGPKRVRLRDLLEGLLLAAWAAVPAGLRAHS